MPYFSQRSRSVLPLRNSNFCPIEFMGQFAFFFVHILARGFPLDLQFCWKTGKKQGLIAATFFTPVS